MTVDPRLIVGLQPLTTRVRTDVTAVRRPGQPAAWTQQPLTDDRLAQHLNGGPARGVCPIKAGESVTMVGLLDFDSHRGEVPWAEMSAAVSRVVDVLVEAWGMEPMLFRSSGGNGVHVVLLWQEPQDAYSVRQFLARVLASAGLKPGTGGVRDGEVEVFPKQDHVPKLVMRAGEMKPGMGSMFVLPLAGKSLPLNLSDEEPLW